MKNVALYNLGCKVNSYEIDAMQELLIAKGYHIIPFNEKADVYIVNTCSVTNMADRKSRQMLHKAKKQNPHAIVVATGCYVQTKEEEIKLDHGIDLLIGNNKKKDLVTILEQYMKETRLSDYDSQEVSENRKDGFENKSLEEIQKGEVRFNKNNKTLNGSTVIDISLEEEFEELHISKTAEHTRAYIKIQDGCNQFCSYCIIPYARGRVRSRPLENIIQEIKDLVKNGYKEIVLTGIHISSYGLDFVKKSYDLCKEKDFLIHLIETIHEIEGLERIRISSIEPRIITENFAKRLSGLSKICPHFHISLQSGCDKTLERMNRRYNVSEYYEKVQILRKYFKDPAITTDVIVGFPGESLEEYEITKAYLEKIDFFEMHVFKYSKRAGTKAAIMESQVSDMIKGKRSVELFELGNNQSIAFKEKYLNKKVEVLIEETKLINGKKYQIGHTKEYIRVGILGEAFEVNQVVIGYISGFLDKNIMNLLLKL